MGEQFRPHSADANLPPPTPELALIRVLIEAHMDGLPRKQATAFMRRALEIMEDEAVMGHIVALRPKGQGPAVARSRAQAHTWLRQVAGRVMTRLG